MSSSLKFAGSLLFAAALVFLVLMKFGAAASILVTPIAARIVSGPVRELLEKAVDWARERKWKNETGRLYQFAGCSIVIEREHDGCGWIHVETIRNIGIDLPRDEVLHRLLPSHVVRHKNSRLQVEVSYIAETFQGSEVRRKHSFALWLNKNFVVPSRRRAQMYGFQD